MITITFAAHVAYLDPMTGQGLLVRPKFADDLSMGGMDSLQAADWNSAMHHLRGLGWEPLEDEDGDGTPMFAGVTTDGRDAIALYGHESVTSIPSIMELAEAGTELASMAGMIPGSWRA
jgi:hypothetical protein